MTTMSPMTIIVSIIRDDEDGTTSSKPDVEVISVICSQADLRSLYKRYINGDPTALGGLLVIACFSCVVRRLIWRHWRQLDRVTESVNNLQHNTTETLRN